MVENRLAIKIAGLNFKNPILVSSGTFGFGFEYNNFFDPSKLGGLVTKAITLKPRKGNPPPRLWETPAGLLNSIGLENPGVKSFVSDYLPEMRRSFSTHIIVNVAENTVEGYKEMVSILSKEDEISALEVNISCPNVNKGGMAFGAQPEMTYQVLKAVCMETDLPVIAKLTPNVTDPTGIARAASEAGCDAISLINTVLGMGIDIENQKPALENVFGGLSGPAIKPIGLRALWQVAEAVDLPLIGMGGIINYEDALEYFLAGASLVSVGVGNFIYPDLTMALISQLENYLARKDYTNIQKLIGKARN